MSSGLQMTRRIRRSPYTGCVERAGVRGFTVVNHMLLPKAFQTSVEDDYWHLREKVQLWDVATQRQVEIKGPDAARLVQWITPRDLSNAKIGQCLYAPLVDENGGMVNDPVLLKLTEDHFWLSIADSDVLLWVKGLAAGAQMKVEVCEPDVAPLAIQGPLAEDLLAVMFGEDIRKIGFFKFGWIDFAGSRQLIARSGFSKQGGFEIYLNGFVQGEPLWNAIMEAGKPFDIRPGCPNLIERIEGGLMSYGNEFTLQNNPFECGLGEYCNLESTADFLARKALETIQKNGIKRQMRGVIFDGDKSETISIPLPVLVGDKQVGQITSGIYSPRLKRNIAMGMINHTHWHVGEKITVRGRNGECHPGEIAALPLI